MEVEPPNAGIDWTRDIEEAVMFTVMTWNVENLFQPEHGTRPEFEGKIAALAKVITDAGADLVAVQEIGDESSFAALLGRLGDRWNGVLAKHFEPSHPIRVGWLSTGLLTDVEEVIDLPPALSPLKAGDHEPLLSQLGRGALAVTYQGAGSNTQVRAMAVHLKSKLLSFPGGRFDTTDEGERVRYGVYGLNRRAAEAAAVRDWVTTSLAGQWRDRPLLVCGDLNDTSEAATTQLMFGPPGSQIGTPGYEHPDHGDPQRLWDVGYKMALSDRFSRINEGRPELIDHILVSHALVGRLTDATTIPLDIASIGTRPLTTPRTGKAPSDHRPVIAHFDL